jgi:hypothetical protein
VRPEIPYDRIEFVPPVRCDDGEVEQISRNGRKWRDKRSVLRRVIDNGRHMRVVYALAQKILLVTRDGP